MNMYERSKIYPVFGIALAIFIIVFALIMAKDVSCLYFLAGVYLTFLFFGCWKPCIKVLPITLLFTGIFAAISYGVTKNIASTYAMANRLIAVGVAIIPGMCIRPVDLTRNLAQLRVPRVVTLGMLIALSFVPLLRLEIKQVREAMKTRGAGSIINPQIFYRAFLIPFIIRLVNISDTLSLSVETRGFTMNKSEVSVYKKVKPRTTDFAILLLIITGAILTVVL